MSQKLLIYSAWLLAVKIARSYLEDSQVFENMTKNDREEEFIALINLARTVAVLLEGMVFVPSARLPSHARPLSYSRKCLVGEKSPRTNLANGATKVKRV
jgi:hypothetical protein